MKRIQRLYAVLLTLFAANNLMAVPRLEELASRSSIDYSLWAMNGAESWQQTRMKLEDLGVTHKEILIKELLNSTPWLVISTLQDEVGWVTLNAYSPDGKRMVMAYPDYPDGIAEISDVQTRQLLYTLEGHTDSVNSVDYSPDGKHLVTASSDSTARIWDAQTGQSLHTLRGHTGAVRSAVYSPPDGSRIVTASWDHTVRIWDAQTGRVLHILEHDDQVHSAAYSSDGTEITTTFGDRAARTWRQDVFINPGTADPTQQTLLQLLLQTKLYRSSTQLPLPPYNPPYDLSCLSSIWQSLSTRARKVLTKKYQNLNLRAAF